MLPGRRNQTRAISKALLNSVNGSALWSSGLKHVIGALLLGMHVVSTTAYDNVNCVDTAVALINVNASALDTELVNSHVSMVDRELVFKFTTAPVVVVICPTGRLAVQLAERAASAVKAITLTGHETLCGHSIQAGGFQLVSASAEQMATGGDILLELAHAKLLKAVLLDEIELCHGPKKYTAVVEAVERLCTYHTVPVAVVSQIMTRRLKKIQSDLKLPSDNTTIISSDVMAAMKRGIALHVEVTEAVHARQSRPRSSSGDQLHSLFTRVAQLVRSTFEGLAVENARAIVFCSTTEACNATYYMLGRCRDGTHTILFAQTHLPA
jgi:hypothetical protein